MKTREIRLTVRMHNVVILWNLFEGTSLRPQEKSMRRKRMSEAPEVVSCTSKLPESSGKLKYMRSLFRFRYTDAKNWRTTSPPRTYTLIEE